ncbi:MAG: hypothetical protein RIR33_1460 [Pseudomonadota bacterium]|jgi:hypothetical protein
MGAAIEQKKTRGLDRPTVRLAFQVLSILAVANFIIYAFVGELIGGYSLNGREIDGRYFLGSHGRLVEVSWAVYLYSFWHAISIFVSWPLIVIYGLLRPANTK